MRHCILGRSRFPGGRREIERRVQLNAEKKSCFCKLQTPGKNRHTLCKFVFRENNFYQLIGSPFHCKFSHLGRKAMVFSYHFLQSLVLSLYVSVLTCCVTLSELLSGEKKRSVNDN